jgi:hypothetical protein
MSKNALIFAGAGASKAVNSAEFPTTLEFFEKLPSEITETQLFQQVVGFIKSQKDDEIVDIEEVLWTLQNLLSFCKDYSRNSTFTAFMLQGNRLAQPLGAGHNLGHLDTAIRRAYSDVERLVSQINARVYELYAHEPDESALRGNWIPLLKELKAREWRTDIVTTNYDTVIETAISAVYPTDYDRFVGLRGRTRKQLDLNAWQQTDPKKGLLTKIHGSLDWQISGKSIFTGSPVYTGDHAKHAIIYPGFKGTETAYYFSLMHRYFGDRVEEADVLMFIGFAFRDEYVNRILERTRPSALVFVLNPVEPQTMPSRGKVQHIAEVFGKSSVTKLLGSL